MQASFLCISGRNRNFFTEPQGWFVQNHEKGVFQRGTSQKADGKRNRQRTPGRGKIERNYIITKFMLFLREKREIFCVFLPRKNINGLLRTKQHNSWCSPQGSECLRNADMRRWKDDFRKPGTDNSLYNFGACHNCFSAYIPLK